MKIITIIVLLATLTLVSPQVNGATQPLNASQDKPVRLYVESYTFSEHAEVHPTGQGYDSAGTQTYSFQGNDVETSKMNWSNGVRGSAFYNRSHSASASGSIDQRSYSYSWTIADTYVLDKSDWPDVGASTWTSDHTHTSDGVTTNCHSFGSAWLLSIAQPGASGGLVGSVGSGASDGFMAIGFEHCKVQNTVLGSKTDSDGAGGTTLWQDNVVYSRQADTVMKLFTGGKALSKRKNLFMISATAKRTLEMKLIPNLNYLEWDLPPQWGPTEDVASTEIEIDRKTLCDDGKLWRIYPDNTTRDVTPRVKNKDYYTFDLPTPTKPIPASITYQTPLQNQAAQLTNAVPGLPPDVDAAHWNIIQANTGDMDMDGVPNFADGFDMFGNEVADTNGMAPSASFVALNWSLPSGVDPSKARVKFVYSGSDPAGLNRSSNPGGGYTYQPGSGGLRIWGKNGSAIRSKLRLDQVAQTVVQNGQPVKIMGDYLAPNVGGANDYYAATNLPGTLYLEAISPSGAPFDRTIQILVDPNGQSGYISVDTIYVTVLDAKLAEATSDSATTVLDKFKDSDTSPVITVNQCVASNVRHNADGTKIVADLTVSGSVNAAVCDVTPGDSGIINKVLIFLNSYEISLDDISLAVSKATNSASLTRPYPYSGSFTKTYTGVEVDSGINLVRFTASDSVVEKTGFAEYTFEVTATDLTGPWVDYNELHYGNVDVTLDFGGAHSLADAISGGLTLIAGAMVSTNPVFSSSLHLISSPGHNPLVFASEGTNQNAWVTVEAGQLQAALQPDYVGTITATISAPAIIPFGTVLTLPETTTNSSVFGHDRVAVVMNLSGIPSTNAVDQVNIIITRTGFTTSTATLTESATNSFFFTNATGAITLQLSAADFDGTNISSTTYDSAGVTVTCPAMQLTGYSRDTIETGTNNLEFTTWEPFEYGIAHPAQVGWNYGWAFNVSSSTLVARSEGGELHLHFVQFQGPPAILGWLAQRPGSTLMQGPDGSYYYKRPGETRPADYAGEPAGGGQGSENDLPSSILGLSNGSIAFGAGFTKGFGGAGVNMIKGTAAGVAGAQEWYLNITFGTDEQQVNAYNSAINVTRQAVQTVEMMKNFVVKIHQDQDAFVASVLAGEWDEANEIAAPYQLATEYTAEFIKQAMDDYLGSGLTDCQRGQIFGGIMFEVAACAIPAAKAGSVSKLGFLCQLRNSAFYSRFPRSAAALEKVLASLTEAAARTPNMCFLAGTKIQVRDGFKNIEEICSGDWVLSRDPASGVQGFKPVLATFVTHPERVYHLQYRVREHGGGGEAAATAGAESGDEDEPAYEIVTTGVHPFFVPSQAEFVEAEKLQVGTDLLLADGRLAEVAAIEIETAPPGQPFTTYNFEVADWHTYFAGESAVWVHNEGRTCERYRKAYTRYLELAGSASGPKHGFKKALEMLPHNLSGEDLIYLADQTAKDAFMLAKDAGNGSDMVKHATDYTWWNTRLAGRKGVAFLEEGNPAPGNSYIQLHHGATDDILEAFGVDLSKRNNCPTVPLSWDRHQRGAARPNAMHSIINRIVKANGWNVKKLSRADAKQLLRETYSEMKWLDSSSMNDVAEVVIRWLENPL